MYTPRKTESHPNWLDSSGIKIYTMSAQNLPVDQASYRERLEALKQEKPVDWANTPAFAIFHDGATMPYLVLAWWENGNELFTSVSVRSGTEWIEDPSRFSFCLWDMEVMWWERNAFVEHMYCSAPSLGAYRGIRFRDGG